MAYKKRLSKKKNWTGRELGKLELQNYAYMVEQWAAETLGDKDPKAEDFLFNIDTYMEILRETWKRSPEENSIYRGYVQIEQWLGKYLNISQSHRGIVDISLGGLETTLEAMQWIVTAIITDKELRDSGAETPKALKEALRTAGDRIEFYTMGIDNYVWGILQEAANIWAYLKALSLTADFYEVPELSIFGMNTEEIRTDTDRVMSIARPLREKVEANMEAIVALLDKQGIKLASNITNKESLRFSFDQLEMLDRDIENKPYTEEAVQKVIDTFKSGEHGFNLFKDSFLIDTLMDVSPYRLMEEAENEK